LFLSSESWTSCVILDDGSCVELPSSRMASSQAEYSSRCTGGQAPNQHNTHNCIQLLLLLFFPSRRLDYILLFSVSISSFPPFVLFCCFNKEILGSAICIVLIVNGFIQPRLSHRLVTRVYKYNNNSNNYMIIIIGLNKFFLPSQWN
jgi:hypothetical protein